MTDEAYVLRTALDKIRVQNLRAAAAIARCKTVLETALADAESIHDEEMPIEDVVQYVKNQHNVAVEKRLNCSDDDLQYCQGREEALWKILNFLGEST